MKALKIVLSTILLFSVFAITASVSVQADEPDVNYVIVFDRDNVPADVAGMIEDAGGQLRFWFPEVAIASAVAPAGSFPAAMKLNTSVSAVGPSGRWSLPQTLNAEPLLDEPTPGDDYYYLYQWDIRRVGADMAWANGHSGSHDTVVAILDTGIDASHPDLGPNVVYEECLQLAGFCAPGTFTHWHGTHVAGTVAAAFDGGRAVGVGPNLGLAAYQVFEDGGAGAYDPVIWWAILDVAHQGFDVINMSLGGYYYFPQTEGDGAAVWTAWNRVVSYATQMGVMIVASAGNGGVSVNGALYHIPGDLSAITNVSATGIRTDPEFPQEDFYDVLAYYSNYGAAVDIAAPGGDVGPDGTPYPFPGVYYLVFSTFPGGYAWAGGTSMASPHVAGAAGLVKDANPDLGPRQVKAILKRSADKLGNRQFFGSGMLNVDDATATASK